jgi:UDP-N-acetylglucosamine:LPS N-acetylglucosamine transferase
MTFLQEEGNVPYVVGGGFGVYTGQKPKRIANAVFKLFNDDKLIQEMSKNAKALSRPEATLSIAKDIGSLAINGKS